jgi:hypothetical protein
MVLGEILSRIKIENAKIGFFDFNLILPGTTPHSPH